MITLRWSTSLDLSKDLRRIKEISTFLSSTKRFSQRMERKPRKITRGYSKKKIHSIRIIRSKSENFPH